MLCAKAPAVCFARSLSLARNTTCRAAALGHEGIVLEPSFILEDDLKAGRLVELLPQWRSLELGIYAVYPSRKFVSPKVRALVDYLVRAFEKRNWSSR